MRFIIQEISIDSKPPRYYLRLEKEGRFRGWAVPKGIPDQFGVKRLAIPIGNYRLDRAEFEGDVTSGLYGPGRISIWDRGDYVAVLWTDRKIRFRLNGEKIEGLYSLDLVEFKESGEKNWLLEKQKEKAASKPVARRAEGSAKKNSPATRPTTKPSRKPPRKKTAPARKQSSGKKTRIRKKKKKQKETIPAHPVPPAAKKPAKKTSRPVKPGKERKFKPRGRTYRRGKKKGRGFTTSSSIVRGLFGMGK
jgi:bifunctional non-homologous end joining protein LigD